MRDRVDRRHAGTATLPSIAAMDKTPAWTRSVARGDGWGMVCGLALVMVSAAPAAQAQSTALERIQLNGMPVTETDAAPRGLRITQRITQRITEPLATAGPSNAPAWLPAHQAGSARQTLLWAEHARSGLAVGLGVEQRQPIASGTAAQLGGTQPQSGGGLLIGASLATGPRSQLTVQTPLRLDEGLHSPDDQRPLRVGLAFNASRPLADFRRGLQVELSGQTTLALKPRGGRIGIGVQRVW